MKSVQFKNRKQKKKKKMKTNKNKKKTKNNRNKNKNNKKNTHQTLKKRKKNWDNNLIKYKHNQRVQNNNYFKNTNQYDITIIYMENNLTTAEQYLIQNNINQFDLTINDIKLMAYSHQQQVIDQIITHTSSDANNPTFNIQNLNDYTQWNGTKLIFKKRYNQQFVDNDLYITINIPQMGAAVDNNIIFRRLDQDLNIVSVKISSQNNGKILNSTQQDNLQMACLFTLVHENINMNLTKNFIGQGSYPLIADENIQLYDDANVINVVLQQQKMVFRISNVLGGRNGFFGKLMYISSDIITYEITFTPQVFRVFRMLLNRNGNLMTPAHKFFDIIGLSVNQAAQNGVNNGVSLNNNIATPVTITQNTWKIPQSIVQQIEHQTHYFKYDNIQRIQLKEWEKQDTAIGVIDANVNRKIKFNLFVERKMFQNRLLSLFIGHIAGKSPICSSSFYQSHSSGAMMKKFVPRNLLGTLKFLNLKFGPYDVVKIGNEMDDYDIANPGNQTQQQKGNDDIHSYFQSQLSNFNVQQDPSKYCIYLDTDQLMKYSDGNSFTLEVTMKFQTIQEIFKLNANPANDTDEKDFEQKLKIRPQDFYCYVMGENIGLISQRGFEFFDAYLLK